MSILIQQLQQWQEPQEEWSIQVLSFVAQELDKEDYGV